MNLPYTNFFPLNCLGKKKGICRCPQTALTNHWLNQQKWFMVLTMLYHEWIIIKKAKLCWHFFYFTYSIVYGKPRNSINFSLVANIYVVYVYRDKYSKYTYVLFIFHSSHLFVLFFIFLRFFIIKTSMLSICIFFCIYGRPILRQNDRFAVD